MKGAVSERNRMITLLVLEGAVAENIAPLYKLSAGRIRRIFWHTMKQIEYKKIKKIVGHMPKNIAEWKKYSYVFKAIIINLPICKQGQRYRK